MNWETNVKILFSFFCWGYSALLANTFQKAIIAGNESIGSQNILATLINPDGTIIALPFSSTVMMNSVAVNVHNNCVVGGYRGSFPPLGGIVQIVLTDNTLVPVDVSATNLIASVDINNSNQILVGGNDYAAYISLSGNVTPLTFPAGPSYFFNTVALNDSGKGIVAGYDGAGFCAFVSPSGSVETITTSASNIYSTDLNNSGVGIVGGSKGSLAYAARIFENGSIDEVSLPNGSIYRVAINSIGNSIIGGYVNAGNGCFGAVLRNSGDLILLNDLPAPGRIFSVDINDNGTGIIVGTDLSSDQVFAAFVSDSGTVSVITSDDYPSKGQFLSCAINNSGAAIIGGADFTLPFSKSFTAIVSPSGIVTKIPTNYSGSTRSVDINGFLNNPTTAPKTFGTSSFAEGIFSLSSQVLNNHLILLKMPEVTVSSLALMVDASPNILSNKNAACISFYPEQNYIIWGSPLFYNSYQKPQGNWPKITNWSGGGVLGFDFINNQNSKIGAGLAYLYNRANLGDGLGHSNYNQGFATVYAATINKNIFMDAALWGGYYSVNNLRNGILDISSSSNYSGWLLIPHLEISIPLYTKRCEYLLDPFVMIDWANNWQGSIKENGKSGFDLSIQDCYTSVLRSEVGARLEEAFRLKKLNICFLEKISYVNRLPFGSATQEALFIGGSSPFSIETFTNRVQNLAALQGSATIKPHNPDYPYGSLNYQAEFGSNYQSHLISLEIGYTF